MCPYIFRCDRCEDIVPRYAATWDIALRNRDMLVVRNMRVCDSCAREEATQVLESLLCSQVNEDESPLYVAQIRRQPIT